MATNDQEDLPILSVTELDLVARQFAAACVGGFLARKESTDDGLAKWFWQLREAAFRTYREQYGEPPASTNDG